MTASGRALVSVYIVAGAVLFAWAQDPPATPPTPPQDPLAALKTKELLADEDRATLKAWIDERVTAVAGEDATAAGQAAGQLRSAYDGTAGFKEAYVAACVAAIGPAMNGAEVVPATRLLAVLSALNEAGAQPIFLDALKDERPAVRLVAAVGLRNLRVKLARAGGGYVTDTLSALRDAGKKETLATVLKTIYQALDFAEAVLSLPEPQANVAAVLDLLAARAQQYESGEVKAEGAEVIGIRVGAALRAAMSEEDKTRFTLAVATMLRYGVTRYVAGEPPLITLDETAGRDMLDRRAQTELLIEEGEKELEALLKPTKAPEITQKMRREAKWEGTAALIKIEMNKWADLLEKAVGKRFHVE